MRSVHPTALLEGNDGKETDMQYEVAPLRGLADVVGTFTRWLYLPDPTIVHVALGTVAANLLEGTPVWTLIVGPPGGGKTETLQSILGVRNTYLASSLTEPSLLSGTPRKEVAEDAKGGLLREIGTFGILVVKDFTSVLSMQKDARSTVLAALREIYDGSWTRLVGTEGGRTLAWTGKVGLLAGVTPTIDRHHAVTAAMGERFLLYRLPPPDPVTQARAALAATGEAETRMRSELQSVVAGLFAQGLPRTPRLLSEDEREQIIQLAALVVRCRSSVERDAYTRDIELIPAAELPARLAKVLERLLAGLDAIGLERNASWRVVATVGLDSMPAIRRALLDVLVRDEFAHKTTELASTIRYPAVTTRRALEDLAAHGVVTRQPGGEGKADTWQFNHWARQPFGKFSELAKQPVPAVPDKPRDPIDLLQDLKGSFGNGSASGDVARPELFRNATAP